MTQWWCFREITICWAINSPVSRKTALWSNPRDPSRGDSSDATSWVACIKFEACLVWSDSGVKRWTDPKSAILWSRVTGLWGSNVRTQKVARIENTGQTEENLEGRSPYWLVKLMVSVVVDTIINYLAPGIWCVGGRIRGRIRRSHSLVLILGYLVWHC